ncbi:O-methyltransferase [Actinomycetospora cinnamomea]|uniref:Putative O-methyltransferase YrrM n=1 Tax=Actinomycetospora cinnamomea TaxID=663609 RepID=A0A2U1EBY7_9PSEU|nr:O-methyltransferase [Actinomycetospora cinnamomea]PVY97468.1 putative O-methyltransferase YrrM [Actinomycetospora cinnamomea]
MSPTPDDVDVFFTDRLHLEDDALRAARDRAHEAGLPDIAVTPGHGALLALLAQVTGARRVLEVGTLGGYSTIWLARTVGPTGRVTSLEIDPHHAEVARACVDAAGVGDRVEIVVGRALDTLPAVEGPLDLVFVDADKENNAAYVRAALELTRPGAVVVVDNVVREGRVADDTDDSPTVRGIREVVDLVAADPRLDTATALQTVDRKGWDGLLLARVTG